MEIGIGSMTKPVRQIQGYVKRWVLNSESEDAHNNRQVRMTDN